MERDDLEFIEKLKSESHDAAFSTVQCPSCDEKMSLSYKSVLEHHVVNMTISPACGVVFESSIILDVATDFQGLLKSMYDDTVPVSTVLMGIDVDDQMKSTIKIAVIPKSPSENKEAKET